VAGVTENSQKQYPGDPPPTEKW